MITGPADCAESPGEVIGHIFQRDASAAAAIRDIRSYGRSPIGGYRPAAGQRADREIEAAAAGPGTVTIRGRIIGAVGEELPVHGQRAVDDEPHRAAAGSAGMPTYIVISRAAAEIGGGERVVIGRPAAGRCSVRYPIAAVAAMRAGAAELAFAAAGARPGRAGIAGAGDIQPTGCVDGDIAGDGQRHFLLAVGGDHAIVEHLQAVEGMGAVDRHGTAGRAIDDDILPIIGGVGDRRVGGESRGGRLRRQQKAGEQDGAEGGEQHRGMGQTECAHNTTPLFKPGKCEIFRM